MDIESSKSIIINGKLHSVTQPASSVPGWYLILLIRPCIIITISVLIVCLIAYGVLCADVRDDINETPLQNACYKGHKDVVQYLVEKANCDISEYNTTTMQCYTFVSTPTLVQVLLTIMARLLLTLLHGRVTLKLLTTSSLYHNNVSSLGS